MNDSLTLSLLLSLELPLAANDKIHGFSTSEMFLSDNPEGVVRSEREKLLAKS
jgi:hypothetical protein